jgi:hypothetical protein
VEDSGSNSTPRLSPSNTAITPNAAPTAFEASAHQVGASTTVKEQPIPMLDVHLRHEATRTWKDFFIHIAIIVIGLLIAISLEQTVEYFHHRTVVAETREALRRERNDNIRHFADATAEFRRAINVTQNNLAILLYVQQHPDAPYAKAPGKINWHLHLLMAVDDSAWETARQNAVTALMPQDEVRRTARLYKDLASVEAAANEWLRAIRDARRYTVQNSDPTSLTPAQIVSEIELTKTDLAVMYRYGSDMRNLSSDFPDFTPAPTTEELHKIVHETD